MNAQGRNPDLKTMLQDASYILNRFQEEAIGIQADIDGWNIQNDTKTNLKSGVAMVGRDVAFEKPNLIRLLSQDEVSATDLFDVYSVINEISGELWGQASSSTSFSPTPSNGVRFAQLASKAQLLGTNLESVLRLMIQKQEKRLSACNGHAGPQ
jgi:hypothetical protein